MDCIEHNQKGIGMGYGTTTIKGRTIRLHRKVYCTYHNIDITSIDGMLVRHTCDNPRCINPEHLELGSHQDNMDDKVKRGRTHKGKEHHSTHLSEEDVVHIREIYTPRDAVTGAKALQAKYNISPRAFHYIISRRNWKNVTS